ncbi:MAG: hypothetical protein ACE1ZS_03015 [Candidatus Poribacteria bacterium]
MMNEKFSTRLWKKSDLEKQSVSLTNRASRWRSVKFHRTTDSSRTGIIFGEQTWVILHGLRQAPVLKMNPLDGPVL